MIDRQTLEIRLADPSPKAATPRLGWSILVLKARGIPLIISLPLAALWPFFARICASSGSGAMLIERRNADVTERQAHDSKPVELRPGETPGSPVAALPASGEILASKRRKTVSERRRATDRSATSLEACSVVSKTLAGRGQEEAEPVDIWRRPRTVPRTWSGCPRILRRRERRTVRRVSWELERPSVAPGLRVREASLSIMGFDDHRNRKPV
jgi:hypothetical protein